MFRWPMRAGAWGLRRGQWVDTGLSALSITGTLRRVGKAVCFMPFSALVFFPKPQSGVGAHRRCLCAALFQPQDTYQDYNSWFFLKSKGI